MQLKNMHADHQGEWKIVDIFFFYILKQEGIQCTCIYIWFCGNHDVKPLACQ